MLYPQLDLDIEADRGVSPVGKETQWLAQKALHLEFKRAVDIGTGTGFIPIFLTKKGKKCDGTDINPLALECARRNAEKNKVKVEFYEADLLRNLKQKYDLIIFNPPFGNSGSSKMNKYIEILKSFIPKGNPIISQISFLLIRKQRKRLITKFLQQLPEKTKVLLWLHPSELKLLNPFQFNILEQGKYMCVVLLSV